MNTSTVPPGRNWILVILSSIAVALSGYSAELRLFLPLNRTAYQDNEWIDVSVLRSGLEGQGSDNLELKLAGEDGSQLRFNFPMKQPGSSAVEHLHVNSRLLRPGNYAVELSCAGTTASTNISVHSHLRRSDYKLINWGRSKGKEQLVQGEAQLGFNLFYGGYAADDNANFIRAGVDFMANCVMSGGHQMDLRSECDWSDPYVIRGGTRRVARRAFIDRTRPNVHGIHFYDEPGLTWSKDPETGEMSAHVVPWQHRSYEAASGRPSPDYRKLDPTHPDQAAHWDHWARWKLGFMDAAWKDAQYGVSLVKPEYVSVTQSQYGYSAFTDGYYFNVVRSLPIISGHGGYHDFGPGYFNPSMFLEFARARDLTRPNWYLPTWYGNTTADEFRLEQYLSFQCNLQGMMAPPDMELGIEPEKKKAAQGIVEANHLMARLGPIFNAIPVTRPPVVVLFSLSQMVHTQTSDRTKNYAHDTQHGRNLPFVYLAGKLLQHQFMPVMDEDVLDGTLAAQHKAVILTSLDYLDANVIQSLESFVQQGGLVLVTADCTVKVNGAVKMNVAPAWPDAEKIAELKKQGRVKEAGELTKMRQELAGAHKLAEAIRPHLEKAGIKPPITSSEPGIVVTRQADGDMEYLFAVNATHNPEGDPMLGMKAVTARLGFEADGRPVYDAIHGGPVRELSNQAGKPEGEFRFGPGQMRVFARPAHPIAGVTISTPAVHRDYLAPDAPLHVAFSASVQSQLQPAAQSKTQMLGGSVPLRVVVQDPLGTVRYDLYRATRDGVLNLRLPLALNDAPGEWKVVVGDLLSQPNENNTGVTASFKLSAPPTCSWAAGATWRAVYWPEDREHVFRFFRNHHHVTLVTGTNRFNAEAAERLQKILKPWNVTCSVMSAADANRPRALTEDEARTWIGLDFAGKGQIKAGESNRPVMVGFAVHGPVILLGTPEDNPLSRFLAEQRFLPYKPQKDLLPGPSRGYVAWQANGIGVNQESIALIAYDAPGMSEAVGTLYEMLAGMEALTPYSLPVSSTIAPATRSEKLPELIAQWRVNLSDRIDGIKAAGDKIQVLNHAGELVELSSDGKISSPRVLEPSASPQSAQEFRTLSEPARFAELRKQNLPSRLVKFAVANQEQTAVAYWGGRLEVLEGGKCKAAHQLQQDVTAVAWSTNRLLVGDADGQLSCLSLK